MTVRIEHGDSRDVLKTLPSDSVDSVCTDPPYSLVSIQKRFGKPGSAEAKHGVDGLYKRASAGFMGQQWDTGEVAFDKEFWIEVYRVLKPGAHLLAFGGTRTYHRLAVAIEDAGFEIRDALQWLYGSGFPKSHDVSKALDKKAGVKREISRVVDLHDIRGGNLMEASQGKEKGISEYNYTLPSTDEAKQWEGWGTALKPACEIICFARKPLSESSVAANVLKWGTGALNIDACRIGVGERQTLTGGMGRKANPVYGEYTQTETEAVITTFGRWPANVCHDGSEEVLEAFPDAPGQIAAVHPDSGKKTDNIYGQFAENSNHEPRGDSGSAARFFFNTREGEESADRRYTDKGSTSFAVLPGERRFDTGSQSRFFYTSKADEHDRFGSKHPTVKPVDLIRWLVRLVTPPGGTVLDPFAGSGTTGAAAMIEDCNSILIEREESYVTNILDRIEWLETDDRYKIFRNAEDKTQIRSEIASVKNAPKSGWWKD